MSSADWPKFKGSTFNGLANQSLRTKVTVRCMGRPSGVRRQLVLFFSSGCGRPFRTGAAYGVAWERDTGTLCTKAVERAGIPVDVCPCACPAAQQLAGVGPTTSLMEARASCAPEFSSMLTVLMLHPLDFNQVNGGNGYGAVVEKAVLVVRYSRMLSVTSVRPSSSITVEVHL